MSDLWCSFCMWPESQNIMDCALLSSFFVVGVLSNTFSRALLGLIRWSPSCPLRLSIFSNVNDIKLNVLLKQWICIEHWIWIAANWQFPCENNSKRTKSCPVSRADMNEPSRQRFTRAHPSEPELPSAIKCFLNIVHIRLNASWKQWICIEHLIWIPMQLTVLIRE